MADGFTAREILMFTDSRATLATTAASSPGFSERALFAILYEQDCYRGWVSDLARSRTPVNRLYSFGLDSQFSTFIGPIFASTALSIFRNFMVRVSRSRFDIHQRVFRGFRFVSDDVVHTSVDEGLLSLFELIQALNNAIALFGNFIIGSMNPARMIDMTLATEAATIAGPEAIKRFNNQLGNTITIPYVLNNAEKEQVKREIGDDPIFSASRQLRNDHVVMASLRHAVREAHKQQHRLHDNKAGQGVKTLVVGAAMREVAEFMHLPNVHYYFANADAKDAARTSVDALRHVVRQKRDNLSNRDRKVFAELKKHPKFTSDIPGHEALKLLDELKKKKKMVGGGPLRQFFNFQDLMRDAEKTDGLNMRGTFKFGVEDYRVTKDSNDCYTLLLAQDWGYNASTLNWLELFARTNAIQCFGYMALPNELLFENMPESDIYRFRRFNRNIISDKHVGAAAVDLSHRGWSNDTGVNDGLLSVDWAAMTHAYSNGYSHPVATWGLLLRHPILSDNKYDFALEVQLESRFGPMVAFSLTRVQKRASVCRTIALPEHNRYVRMLDLPALIEQRRQTGFVNSNYPLPYFSVHAVEFYTTLAYALSLDLKSLTKQVLATFVKVHRAGASLVSKELKAKWHLEPENIYKFVQCVYYHVMYLQMSLGNEVSQVVGVCVDWRQKLINCVKRGVQPLYEAVSWLWSWMMDDNLVDKLVVVMPDEFFQEGVSGAYQMRSNTHMFDKDGFVDKTDFSAHLAVTSEFCDSSLLPVGYNIDEWLKEEDVLIRAVYREKHALESTEAIDSPCAADPDVELLEKFKAGYRIVTDKDMHKCLKEYHKMVKLSACDCGTCIRIAEKSGEQIVDCFNQADSQVALSVSLAELNLLKEQLRDEARVAPDNLRKTLEAAMDTIPKEGFEFSVRVEYIKGGPGTGKSRLIRDLADPVRDLVVAPFQKLRVDYKDQAVEGGLKSWEFHTHHRAMTMKNRESIYFDEFTGIPFVVFAVIAYNCQAKKVVLVGDEQQTGVLEGNNEGEPITKRIDLLKVSKHNLLCNFRNPAADVKRINSLFGTRMIPMSTSGVSWTLGPVSDVAALVESGKTLVHFSWEASRALFGDVDKERKTSVRCNQGSTHEKVVLPVINVDKNLIQQDKLAFVALTRHKLSLEILFDTDPNLDFNVAQFKRKLTEFPSVVEQDDYVTRLFFGLNEPACGFSYELGPITQRFIDIVHSVGGFEPAGVKAEAFQAISDDVEVECLTEYVDRRLEEYSAAELEIPVSKLSQRKNNCLLVAVAAALQVEFVTLHSRLLGSAWYRKWLELDSLSDKADCEELAKALGANLLVIFEGRSVAEEWSFKPEGALSKIVLHHKDNDLGGHFYHRDAVSTLFWADRASVVAKGKAVEMTSSSGARPSKAMVVDPAPPSVSDRLGSLMAGAKDSLRVVGDWFPTIPGEDTPLYERVQLADFDFAGGAQVPEEMQEAYANRFGLRQTFVDYATEFVPAVPVSYLMPTAADFKALSVFAPKHVKPVYDAFRMSTAYEFESVHSYYVPYINHEMSNVVGEKFVGGDLNMEILMPTNQRRHPKNQTVKYHSMGAGPALMYFKNNGAQQLQVLQARYLGRRAADLPSFKRDQVAKRIADLFVDECLAPDMASSMSLENLYQITSRSFADMAKKNYEKQMSEVNTVNARVYRFQLKDIEKPFKEAVVDLGKAGQGILAWSKEAHVLFMLAFRVLNDVLLKSVKSHVVYDNAMSEEDFLARVNGAMALTPDCAINSVIDATACDSGQNGFTQMIERQIYARLGASDVMLDWYFSFRQHYILQSEHVRAPMQNVKTSGEPGTLLGNSILMAALLNALVRGDGPFVLVCKGDDGFKRQANPRYDADMLMSIKSFCPLDFKIDIDVPITFCGYALVEGTIHPDVQRKLAKAVTHRFRSYEHFAEYQISLRDWVARVPAEPEPLMEFFAINAQLSGRTLEQIEHMFMMLQSLAHIGKKQFLEQFPVTTVEFEPMPHELRDCDPGVIHQKFDTVFVPLENHLKRQAQKVKHNLK